MLFSDKITQVGTNSRNSRVSIGVPTRDRQKRVDSFRLSTRPDASPSRRDPLRRVGCAMHGGPSESFVESEAGGGEDSGTGDCMGYVRT